MCSKRATFVWSSITCSFNGGFTKLILTFGCEVGLRHKNCNEDGYITLAGHERMIEDRSLISLAPKPSLPLVPRILDTGVKVVTLRIDTVHKM